MVSAKRPSKSACPERRDGRGGGSVPKAAVALIRELPRRIVSMGFNINESFRRQKGEVTQETKKS
jgi:hypothetical protein